MTDGDAYGAVQAAVDRGLAKYRVDATREVEAILDAALRVAERTAPVDAELLAQLVPHAPRTGVVAIARRPAVDVASVLAAERPAPVVLLEDPRTMGNMGACVRVAAAAAAAAVLTTDPYVTTDADLRPLDEVLERSDLLVVGAPHQAYAALSPTQPVIDIWDLYGAGVTV